MTAPADKVKGGAGSVESWAEYWSRDDFWKDSELWRVNTELFFRRAREIVTFGREDTVLDVGCGPGHLETLLSPLVKQICAVDVAEQFVDRCRERCAGLDNVTVRLMEEDYTDLTSFGSSFTVILAVSVVQYYRGFEEIEALVRSARQVAAPGAVMLIADLPLRPTPAGFLRDGFHSFVQAAGEGYLPLLVRTAFARWVRSSRYRTFYKESGQLYFTGEEMSELVRRMGFQTDIVRRSLSIYANRPSLLIRFR